MGRRGPAPTPTAVLEARGSWRAKIRADEPESKAILLIKPRWVTGGAARHWTDISGTLYRMGVTTANDLLGLGMLVDAFGQYLEYKRVIEAEGLVRERKSGPCRHPLITPMQHAWELTMRACREYGMTPASRTGIHALSKAEGELVDATERFFKK